MNSLEFGRTILSQYSNSTRLLALLREYNIQVDPTKDILKWFNEVYNLDTCGTYGLDVWGTIVAAPRNVLVNEQDYFGFIYTGYHPFNQAPFWSGSKTSNYYRLTDSAYRQMIYFKAMVNIMNTAIPDINKVLYEFFQRVRPGSSVDVYAKRVGIMRMNIIFRFNLTPVERAIFRTYGGGIYPGGVGVDLWEIPYETFGFFGSTLYPFNQGVFSTGSFQSVF